MIGNYYNKIAEEYVKQHGYKEHLSVTSLKKFLAFLPSKSKVLDVGCGGGQDSKFLIEKGCNVLGVELASEMVKLAKKYVPEGKFKVIDVMKLSTKIKYDGIWCCRVFHNIPIKDQAKFLKKLNSLLKKGGILYITSAVSNQKSDYETLDRQDDYIKKYLSSKSFKNMLLEQNFRILKFKYWVGKKGMEIFAKK